MQRFTGQDASFLYMETPSVHMHTLKVAIVDLPVKISDNDLFELVRVSMETKLHLVPRLRLRPVEVPGGIHHPMWVNDPNFNIGRHLFRTKIAAPGGHREMDRAIAGIASTQLPRDRPLWETWMLEGLADGGVVLVTKIHHALADGVASAAMLAKVMNLAASDLDVRPPQPSWFPDSIPPRLELIKDALRGSASAAERDRPSGEEDGQGRRERPEEHQEAGGAGSVSIRHATHGVQPHAIADAFVCFDVSAFGRAQGGQGRSACDAQ